MVGIRIDHVRCPESLGPMLEYLHIEYDLLFPFELPVPDIRLSEKKI